MKSSAEALLFLLSTSYSEYNISKSVQCTMFSSTNRSSYLIISYHIISHKHCKTS